MSASERFRILIADDSDVCRTVLAILLKNSGFDVTGVINGREALAKLRAQSFHLAIFDHDMPELNGLDTLAGLRAFDAKLPVAIVSGKLSASIRARYESLHIAAIYEKPVDPRKLRDKITAILERHAGRPPAGHAHAAFPALGEADAALEKPVFAGASPAVRKLVTDFGRIREFRAAATIIGGPGAAFLDAAVALGEARDALLLACGPERLDAALLARHIVRAREKDRPLQLIVLDAERLSPPQQDLVESLVSGSAAFSGLAILCSHTDLGTLADSGGFNETLLMRAGVMKLVLPPLAQRRADLSLMARAVLRRIGAAGADLAPDCRAQLETQDWPGDYRELHRTLEIAHKLHPRQRELSLANIQEARQREPQWREPLYHDVLRATLEGE